MMMRPSFILMCSVHHVAQLAKIAFSHTSTITTELNIVTYPKHHGETYRSNVGTVPHKLP